MKTGIEPTYSNWHKTEFGVRKKKVRCVQQGGRRIVIEGRRSIRREPSRLMWHGLNFARGRYTRSKECPARTLVGSAGTGPGWWDPTRDVTTSHGRYALQAMCQDWQTHHRHIARFQFQFASLSPHPWNLERAGTRGARGEGAGRTNGGRTDAAQNPASLLLSLVPLRTSLYIPDALRTTYTPNLLF